MTRRGERPSLPGRAGLSRHGLAGRAAVAVILLMLGRARAEPPPGKIVSYTCRRATGAIRVDGKLDEPAWQAAEVLKDWTYPWYREGPKQGAKAWLLWDDEALYFAAQVEDTDLLGKVETTDERQVWHDERFEFYVDSNPGDEVYRCWEFTTMKHKLDYAVSWGRRFHFGWDCVGLQYAVRVEGTLNDEQPDRGYRIEARVPFRPNFEHAVEFPPRKKATEGGPQADQPKFVRAANVPPKPGDIWRLGVNREDQYTHEGKERYVLAMWVDPKVAKPDFHVPTAFGKLIFAE